MAQDPNQSGILISLVGGNSKKDVYAIQFLKISVTKRNPIRWLKGTDTIPNSPLTFSKIVFSSPSKANWVIDSMDNSTGVYTDKHANGQGGMGGNSDKHSWLFDAPTNTFFVLKDHIEGEYQKLVAADPNWANSRVIARATFDTYFVTKNEKAQTFQAMARVLWQAYSTIRVTNGTISFDMPAVTIEPLYLGTSFGLDSTFAEQQAVYSNYMKNQKVVYKLTK